MNHTVNIADDDDDNGVQVQLGTATSSSESDFDDPFMAKADDILKLDGLNSNFRRNIKTVHNIFSK